jgi:hypothetical protein
VTDDGAGGTTNIVFDAKYGRWLKATSSLAGTSRNCACGMTETQRRYTI